jgi:hypothetical protein
MNNYSKKLKRTNKENTRKHEEEMEIETTITTVNKTKSDLPEKMYYYVHGIKFQNNTIQE